VSGESLGRVFRLYLHRIETLVTYNTHSPLAHSLSKYKEESEDQKLGQPHSQGAQLLRLSSNAISRTRIFTMSDSTANPVPAVAVPDEGKDVPVAVEEKKHASGLSLDQRQELCLSIGGGCVRVCVCMLVFSVYMYVHFKHTLSYVLCTTQYFQVHPGGRAADPARQTPLAHGTCVYVRTVSCVCLCVCVLYLLFYSCSICTQLTLPLFTTHFTGVRRVRAQRPYAHRAGRAQVH
jgi:hypothetical protein